MTNQEFIDQLEIEDIPWIRLTTPYGRADQFPKYLSDINQDNNQIVKNAFDNIEQNIEHQSTLWAVTPFALVFLVRMFQQIIVKDKKSLIDDYKMKRLLSIFKSVIYAYQMACDMQHADPLPYFLDMLNEDFLWSEEYDEEEDALRYEEGPFPDDLFYSFYEYSYQVILTIKPLIQQYKDMYQDGYTKKCFDYLNENL